MDTFHLYPIGSILSRPEEVTQGYLDIVSLLPQDIKDILAAPDSAAFVLGLVKSYNISEDQAPSIAFGILEVAIGKKTLAQLPAVFSQELGVSDDQAQKMASEIEHDIFGPVKAELDAFLKQQTGGESPKLTAVPVSPVKPSNPKNVLDLKEITAAKKQEQITTRPPQQQLPKRQLPPPLTPPRAPLRPQASRDTAREGTTTAAPKFPLPPLRPSRPAGQAPKPPVTPINLAGY